MSARLKVIAAIQREGRYSPENLAFRKACIRERLAEIKQRRDAFSKELSDVVAAQKGNGQKPTGLENPHPYVADNLTFRRAYLRLRMEQLKEERQKLIEQRDAFDAKIGSTKKGTAGEAKRRSPS